MSILIDARKEFKKKQRQAYVDVRKDLEEQIVGEEVRLEYPFEQGEGGVYDRIPEVTGTVDSVDTGTIMEEGIEFTVFVELESGSVKLENGHVEFESSRTFIDPDEIYIQS